jgi:hypothetical protein
MQCAVADCVNNDEGLCTVESMLSICENGQCALLQKSPERTIKVLQDRLSRLSAENRRIVEENEQLAKTLEELKKQIPYPPVGSIVFVEDPMWGLLPCKIDKPFHFVAGTAGSGSCTFNGIFTPDDLGVTIFESQEQWAAKQAETAEKYEKLSEGLEPMKYSDHVEEKKLDNFIYAKDYQ